MVIDSSLGVWLFPAFVIEGMANLGAPIPHTGHVDMWPATLGFPGLVGGLVLSGLVAAFRRGRDYDALPAGLLLGLGVATGLVVAAVFLGIGWIGGKSTAWEIGFAVLMSALSAGASAVAFRSLRRRRLQRA